MGKLSEIKKIISEAKEMVEEVKGDVLESVNEYNLSLEEFEREKEVIKSSTILEVESTLEEIENLDKSYEPDIEKEELEKLLPLPTPQIYEVKEPTGGFFAAKFFGFIAFILSLTAFLVASLYLKKYDLSAIDFNQWQSYVNDGFSFYSSLILQNPSSDPIVGGVVVTAISFVIGYIVYFIMVQSAASNNLKVAKEIFEEAKKWVEEQREFIEKLKAKVAFLKDTNHTLKALKIFGDEFSDRVRRDIFFEGNDYSSYSTVAKDETDTLQNIDVKLNIAANLELYTKEDEIIDSVKKEISSMKELVDAIKAKIYG